MEKCSARTYLVGFDTVKVQTSRNGGLRILVALVGLTQRTSQRLELWGYLGSHSALCRLL